MMKRIAGLVVVLVLVPVGATFADPAQVGALFATGNPSDLAQLKLMEEVNRLVEIGRGQEAEALVYQVLQTYPLHAEALEAVDFLVNHVRDDRSVPDEDRRQALKQAYELGVRVAEVWVKDDPKGQRGTRAAFQRIVYSVGAAERSFVARRQYADELAAFIEANPQSAMTGRARRELIDTHVGTGQFVKALAVCEEVVKTGGSVEPGILGRCYYELGDFTKATEYIGRGASRVGLADLPDLLTRAYLAMGQGRQAADSIGRGALIREPSVWLHVERDWQEVPRLRQVDRKAELPPGAQALLDLRVQLQTSCQTNTRDLVSGQQMSGTVDLHAYLDPVVVPKGSTDWRLSVLVPVSLDTTIPYGSVYEESGGYRAVWRGSLTPTADDWVNCPSIWAESLRGVAKNPSCQVWRTCKVLDNNRVQVDVFVSTLSPSFITLDNQQALIDQPLALPEDARVSNNRTIYVQAPAMPSSAGKQPEKPFCSYVVRCFKEVNAYYPRVVVLSREPAATDTADRPPATKWTWNVEGNVLELSSSVKLAVRKATISWTSRYELAEILEAK